MSRVYIIKPYNCLRVARFERKIKKTNILAAFEAECASIGYSAFVGGSCIMAIGGPGPYEAIIQQCKTGFGGSIKNGRFAIPARPKFIEALNYIASGRVKTK
jgi:hypothetical protein